MSTLDRLNELQAEAVLNEATATPFRPDFEVIVIPHLLSFPQFIEVGGFRADYFSTIPTRTVVKAILDYHKKFGVVPSRDTLRDVLERVVTEDDPYEEIFELINSKPNPRDTPYVLELLKDWLRDRAYAQIFSEEAIEAFHRRDYKVIEDLVARAARVHSCEQGEPFGSMGIEELLAEEPKMDWLIENILQKDQPFAIGGKDKCLKTGMTVDMMVSLATGTPFLGKFACKPTRVLFFSAESGKDNIQRRVNAIQSSRGVRSTSEMFRISFACPQLSNLDDLAKIGQLIERHKSEVVCIDPVYLTLLAGDDTGASPSSMFDMGTKLATLNHIITARGATLVLVHHYKKTTPEGKLSLNEFSHTGLGSFVRQSLHIGRRAPFSGTRSNQMCLMNHGEGIGNSYLFNADEGEHLEKWVITGLEPASVIAQRDARVRVNENTTRLLEYLRENGPSSKSKISTSLGFNKLKVDVLIATAGDRIGSIIGGNTGNIKLYHLNEETNGEAGEGGD